MLDVEALSNLLHTHREALAAPVRAFELNGRHFDFSRRRLLMGVVNLSPDSWYSESICATGGEAIARGLSLSRQGADLVDVGAESTLAHAERVGPREQCDRIVPVVRALAREGVTVSVESYYPEVLEAAALAGAAVFNLTGIRAEGEVLKLARRFDAAVIHCYVQGETPRAVGDFRFSPDMTATLEAYFRERLALADGQGVHRNIVDPGLGFYYRNLDDGRRRVGHQLSTFVNAFRLHRLGWPILNILPHAPEIFGEAHRRTAEPVFAMLALLGGTHILRTHELDAVARVRAVLECYTQPLPE